MEWIPVGIGIGIWLACGIIQRVLRRERLREERLARDIKAFRRMAERN